MANNVPAVSLLIDKLVSRKLHDTLTKLGRGQCGYRSIKCCWSFSLRYLSVFAQGLFNASLGVGPLNIVRTSERTPPKTYLGLEFGEILPPILVVDTTLVSSSLHCVTSDRLWLKPNTDQKDTKRQCGSFNVPREKGELSRKKKPWSSPGTVSRCAICRYSIQGIRAASQTRRSDVLLSRSPVALSRA
jgi:hypothetical protein